MHLQIRGAICSIKETLMDSKNPKGGQREQKSPGRSQDLDRDKDKNKQGQDKEGQTGEGQRGSDRGSGQGGQSSGPGIHRK